MISFGYEIEGDLGYYVYDFGKLLVMIYYWFLGEEFRGDMVSLFCSFFEFFFCDLLVMEVIYFFNCFKSLLFVFI